MEQLKMLLNFFEIVMYDTKVLNSNYFLKPVVFFTCSLIRAYSLLDPSF